MKRLLLLLPLAACAALAGCADYYGPAGYGAYPAYPGYYSSPYAYGPVYGGPSVALGLGNGYAYRDHPYHGRDHDWRRGEHHGAGERHGAGRHDRAEDTPGFGPDRNGTWHFGGGRGTADRVDREHTDNAGRRAPGAEQPHFGPDRNGVWHFGG